VIAIIQARSGSSRLPGKVLAPVLGQPMLALQIERVRRARRLEGLVVATSESPADDAVAQVAVDCGTAVYRGALEDVLDRVYHAAVQAEASHVVRLTGDCPLIEPQVIDLVVGDHLRVGADYTSNTLVRTFPDGLDVEVIRFRALAEAHSEARLPSEREHVTPFVCNRPQRFQLQGVEQAEDLSRLRWVVDCAADLQVIEGVFARLYPGKPDFTTTDVLRLAAGDPALFAINASIDPQEGWARSLRRDATFLAGGGSK
jgi:spore coat polysaccharide biosynthesis protein SpsF